VLADGPGHGEHVFEIRRAVLVRRRAYRNELKLAVRDAVGRRRRETQAFGFDIGFDERIEAGLVDRDFAPIEAFDFLASTSTHNTSLPASARQAPVTRPT
jgi:hypothetical protein